MGRNEEREVARRWWALPRNTWLPLLMGGYCLVCFTGRPGGPAGPDVRDAVLCFASECTASSATGTIAAGNERTSVQVGAVEFHVRATDWDAHQHQYDVRYNAVLLHIVLFCDTHRPTRREDGQSVPVCSLQEVIIHRPDLLIPEHPAQHNEIWPCQRLLPHLDAAAREHLLLYAGMLRFEEKTQRFIEQLHTASPCSSFDFYDVCLLPALLEGLGYGREQALFRTLGLQFVQSQGDLTVFDTWVGQLRPLDRVRLNAFRTLYMRWLEQGCWRTFSGLVLTEYSEVPWNSFSCRRALRAALRTTGLGLARSDILLINVIFPFAMAVAIIQQNALLGMRVETLYRTYPALPSNHITRAMSLQLRLPTEPRRACCQQGLHYIYQQTCREKRCDLCIIGSRYYTY
ncbi:DUF2851 family protein [Ktedonobacteria bacterium brp13]|nr:DUF2851 family protein [Ktedonobacteria bacterium brp13]